MVEYVPRRGDIIWLTLTPERGHEQAGRRPALVLSTSEYNEKVGLGLFCPITSKTKNYPFEVYIPENLGIQGVILSDQIKSLDWRSRKAEYICKVANVVVNEVTRKLKLLLPAS